MFLHRSSHMSDFGHLFFKTFFIIGFSKEFAYGHIIRIPGCIYKADYTMHEDGKYLNATIIKSLPLRTSFSCGLKCMTTYLCASYNFNSKEKKCELLYENIGQMLLDPDWSFYTTDFSDPKNRGGKCRKLKPCPVESMCIESCEENGYSCLPYYKEIAQGKTVTAINYLTNNRRPEKAVDGLPYSDPKIAYSCYVSKDTLNPWLLLDLGAVYQMEIIRIVNEDYCPTCASRLFHMYITIGLTDIDPINNPVCVKDANQANIEKVDYACARFIMKGRYVFVHLKRKTLMAICEIQVYILA